MKTEHSPVVVIGGGIAALVAAARVSQRGVPVTIVEKAGHLGGRAVTQNRNGFLFNLGPHALYRKGHLHETLRQLGVPVRGALPPTRGALALNERRLHGLPIGVRSLLGTSLLTMHGKFELARLLAMLPRVEAAAVRQQTLSSWLEAHITDGGARAVIEMLVRVSTFTHDVARQSAGAAIAQLQLALRGNVLYLNGGWHTIVAGLRAVVDRAGGRIRTGAPAISIDWNGGEATAVRCADGTVLPASAVVLAVPPAEVDRLTGATHFAAAVSPVHLATLDVGLRRLPNPRTLVAFGVDEPLYFSVHSAAARLAQEGSAVIHVSKYLAPGERAGRDVEGRLEGLLDQLQHGWRDEVVSKQYLPNLIVTHAELQADNDAARPSSPIEGFSNVFIAGDWVGARGQLSDAAAASGEEAAALAIDAAARRRYRAAERDRGSGAAVA